ncbi:hypothetical protein IFR04_005816 [Cadophora malorum]|uniref:DUF300-domain-containing protein n=1 Tax=Cadophora malorum TaxID=108018 RepID=A0A8H7TLH0_9HELO|nr:hypothetical protein IFR04_005816 [Cadophora malorum]
MGIFHDDNSTHNHTCPTPQYTDVEQVSIVGNITFHQLIVIISGASLAFSCLVSFFLIFRHATHYSIPKEQKQIIRIVFMIPVFTACSLLSVAFNDAALYIKPIDDLYEAFALASFFLLLCAFVEENDVERQAFFTASGTTKHFMAATFGAFQFPVVMLILLVVTEVTEATGVYCATSNKPYFAHIWVTVITLLSTIIAIMSILKFYKALKPRINHRKPLSKLVAFKGIVFLNFIQNAIFSFLQSSNDLKPTKHYTFHDLSVGIPNLLLSLEMVIFSILFLYIYRTGEYCFKKGAAAVPLGHGGYQGGLLGLRAYGDALNITDVLRGIASVPVAFSSRESGGNNQEQWPAYSQYESLGMISQPQQEYHVPEGNLSYGNGH